MIPEVRIEKLLARYAALESALSAAGGIERAELVRISKERAELAPSMERVRELQRVRREISELTEIVDDPDGEPEMAELARAERESHERRLPEIEHAVKLLLLPTDEADSRNAILEVRAGSGGEEAALFAADLFRMYQRYAEIHDWKFQAMHLSETGIGGYKEAIAGIAGKGVFARLKFESGVHRVQRVPLTESSGRIHTSAATVAVLPEAEEIDVTIEDKDLRIDVFRARGPGGQSVNTTDSAVRITHLPTGIVVQQQDEKSQHKNRAKAMKVLRSRMFDRERLARDAERAKARRDQVGTGDRSERVRTYNFPQGRVSDHRIKLTLHKLERVLAGEALDEIIDALISADETARLAAFDETDGAEAAND